MDITQLNLETVTPMFLHGHDNKVLELRPPPFKALFRYWWRATVGEMDEDELREREGNLFGNTKKRPPLLVRVPRQSVSLQADERAPLPHRGSFTTQAYRPNGTFNLTLAAPHLSLYKKIAEIGFLLGGVGNRSRRGFGSLRYQDWTFPTANELQDQVYKTVDGISPGRFRQHSSKIQIDSSIRLPNYPAIRAVYFGVTSWRSVDDLLRRIGQVTSQQRALGNDAVGSIRPRMASPIHVRIQKVGDQFVPIITQLHSVFPGPVPHSYNRKQLDFINAVLI